MLNDNVKLSSSASRSWSVWTRMTPELLYATGSSPVAGPVRKFESDYEA